MAYRETPRAYTFVREPEVSEEQLVKALQHLLDTVLYVIDASDEVHHAVDALGDLLNIPWNRHRPTTFRGARVETENEGLVLDLRDGQQAFITVQVQPRPKDNIREGISESSA